MLGADVMMIQAARLLDGKFQHLLDASREVNPLPGGLSKPGKPLHDLADAVRLQPQVAQDPACHAAILFHQTQQQMLGVDGRLAQPFGFLLSQSKHPPGALGKSFQSSHRYSFA